MELEDTLTIEQKRSVVWNAIIDPETLKECIPGCTEISGSLQEGYQALVTQKFGPIKATFRGSLTLEDIVEETSCVIVGQGKAGPAGFASGTATLSLSDTDQGTELSYHVTVKIGGKLAQLGTRLIGGVAKRLANQFFEKFVQLLDTENCENEMKQIEPTAPADIPSAPVEAKTCDPQR